MTVKEEKKEKPVSVDEQFLKDFADKGGKITDNDSGKTVSDIDALLDKVADSGDGSTPAQEKLHKKAVAKGAADTTKEDEAKAQREAARIARLQEQERRRHLGKAGKVYSSISKEVQGSVTDPLIAKGASAVDAVSSLKTIGGIGLLLAILVFLLFVVVQVNAAGDTRLKQFWYMLNGRAKLAGSNLGVTASGDFGPGSSNTITTTGGRPSAPGGGNSPQPIANLPILGNIYSAPDVIQTPFGPVTLPDISIGGPPTHTGGG